MCLLGANYYSRDSTTAFGVFNLNFKSGSAPTSPGPEFPPRDCSPSACTPTSPRSASSDSYLVSSYVGLDCHQAMKN